MEEFLHKPEGRRLIKKGNGIALARYLYKEASKIRFELRKNLMEVSWDKDVVIANLTTAFWMTPITEKLNNRLVLLNLNPPVVPTREFPYLQFDFINTPWFNLLTYRLIRSFIWGLNKRQILVTHCFSNELISRPKDWPINSQITGYLNLTIDKREKENTEIPDDLIIWVENGEKPIYIGFGSMPIPNEEVLKKAIRDILATTKNRIVFCEGWSHISNLPTCDNLRVVKQVNHDWVFPKCKLAVIHGGIGTIHSALKAGLPLIIASIFADQPIWGKIIEKKGLGLHIPFNKLSSKKLVMAFDKVMTKEIGEKVSTVSDRMNNEDGLETTLNTIEGYKIS
jgi:sterol 3beta-glucosyltransferase